jgi:hypothetical protein
MTNPTHYTKLSILSFPICSEASLPSMARNYKTKPIFFSDLLSLDSGSILQNKPNLENATMKKRNEPKPVASKRSEDGCKTKPNIRVSNRKSTIAQKTNPIDRRRRVILAFEPGSRATMLDYQFYKTNPKPVASKPWRRRKQTQS